MIADLPKQEDVLADYITWAKQAKQSWAKSLFLSADHTGHYG